MKDGLWIVNYKNICAAFVVEHGAVTSVPPILRKNFAYWKTKAKWYPTAKKPLDELSGKGVELSSMN